MSLLDDILEKLEALPPDQHKEVVEEAMSATADMRFVPLPGPQTEAYLSDADVLLYGGQAGGGKSFLLMGLASQEHTRSIIFRRESSQTDGLEEAGKSIIGTTASYNGTDKEWKWDTGRSVKLAGMQLAEDWNKHAGRERDLFCVGAGTKVIMGDGSKRAIETLLVGEMVATLEGPRRVVRVLPVQRKPCVKVLSRGKWQIQSRDHPVMTSRGWLSVDALNDVRLSISGRVFGSISQSFARTYVVLASSLSRFVSGLLHTVGCVLEFPHIRRDLALPSVLLQPGAGICFARYYGRSQEPYQPLSEFALLTPPQQHLESALPFAVQPYPWRGVSHAHASSAPLSWLDRYSGGSRQYDERPRRHPNLGTAQEAGQQALLLLADVETPTPIRSPTSDAERTQKYTSQPSTYAHPYTKEIRQVGRSCSLQCAAFGVSPVGYHDVYDLQIEEVNHYITEGGFINQNCFDEAGEFLRQQVSSLFGWNRGPDGQRCRVILASNPPRSSDGYWLTEWFAPWLDLQHHNPAAPGELRYAHLIDGSPVWVDGPDSLSSDRDKPLSFTFIPAKLSDNPFRDTPEYRSKLESLPEPLRSQLKFGDFAAGTIDGINQAIPTDWVKQAQERWKPNRPVGIPMCAIGVDVAQGGTDQTVLATRFDGWYMPIEAIPGVDTPSGAEVAGKVLARRHDNAKVIVDLGGGWGGDALAHLTGNNVDAVGYMGVKDSVRRTRDNQLRFSNVRTEAYWRFREALDPYTQEGSPIQLPNDRELLADLTAPTYETKSGKGGMVIHLEPKDKLVKRLGRSPDKGDAVVMAWWAGERAVTDLAEWRKAATNFNRTPVVVMGRQAARRGKR